MFYLKRLCVLAVVVLLGRSLVAVLDVVTLNSEENKSVILRNPGGV